MIYWCISLQRKIDAEIFGIALTALHQRHKLHCVNKAHPLAFGMTTVQLQELAKQAVRDAITKNVQAGVSTTVLLNGCVQSLDASDLRLQSLLNGRGATGHES